MGSLSAHAVAPSDDCVRLSPCPPSTAAQEDELAASSSPRRTAGADICPPSTAAQEDEVAASSSPRRTAGADICVSPQSLAQRVALLSPEWQAALLSLVEQAELGADPPGHG